MTADDGGNVKYSLKDATTCSASCNLFELVSGNERYCVSNCTGNWANIDQSYVDATDNKTCMAECPSGS